MNKTFEELTFKDVKQIILDAVKGHDVAITNPVRDTFGKFIPKNKKYNKIVSERRKQVRG